MEKTKGSKKYVRRSGMRFKLYQTLMQHTTWFAPLFCYNTLPESFPTVAGSKIHNKNVLDLQFVKTREDVWDYDAQQFLQNHPKLWWPRKDQPLQIGISKLEIWLRYHVCSEVPLHNYMVCLRGNPGTGKTFYIKYLCAKYGLEYDMIQIDDDRDFQRMIAESCHHPTTSAFSPLSTKLSHPSSLSSSSSSSSSTLSSLATTLLMSGKSKTSSSSSEESGLNRNLKIWVVSFLGEATSLHIDKLKKMFYALTQLIGQPLYRKHVVINLASNMAWNQPLYAFARSFSLPVFLFPKLDFQPSGIGHYLVDAQDKFTIQLPGSQLLREDISSLVHGFEFKSQNNIGALIQRLTWQSWTRDQVFTTPKDRQYASRLKFLETLRLFQSNEQLLLQRKNKEPELLSNSFVGLDAENNNLSTLQLFLETLMSPPKHFPSWNGNILLRMLIHYFSECSGWSLREIASIALSLSTALGNNKPFLMELILNQLSTGDMHEYETHQQQHLLKTALIWQLRRCLGNHSSLQSALTVMWKSGWLWKKLLKSWSHHNNPTRFKTFASRLWYHRTHPRKPEETAETTLHFLYDQLSVTDELDPFKHNDIIAPTQV